MGMCIICGKEAGVLSQKTKKGHVCKECASYVPYNVNISSASADYLNNTVSVNKEKAKQFECTASYGNLYIDAVRNMFLISRKANKGESLEFGHICRIEECEELGLFCTDIKNVGKSSNFVVCTIKLRVKERNKDSRDYIVLVGESCSFKPSKVDRTMLECKEPEKLSVFRNMFNQMVDNAIFAMARKLDYLNELKRAVDTATKDVASFTDSEVVRT